MPLSAPVKDHDDLFFEVHHLLSEKSNNFDKIPHLTSYDPQDKGDVNFVTTIIESLNSISPDETICRSLLEHTNITLTVANETTLIPESSQAELSIAIVNHRNSSLLRCLDKLKFNLGLKSSSGKDPLQGIAEQAIFKIGKEIPTSHSSEESAEREGVRIILENGNTELKSKMLIDFVLFGIDEHLISLKDNLNNENLKPDENRFEKFFSSENSTQILEILQQYKLDHPQEAFAVYQELRETYNTFEQNIALFTLDTNLQTISEIKAPSTSITAYSEGTSKAKDTSQFCCIS